MQCPNNGMGRSGPFVTFHRFMGSSDGGVMISVDFKTDLDPRPPRIHNLPSGSTTLDAKALGVLSNATFRHVSFGSTRLGLKYK